MDWVRPRSVMHWRHTVRLDSGLTKAPGSRVRKEAQTESLASYDMHVLGNNKEMNRDAHVDNYGGSMMMVMDMMCRQKTIQKHSSIHSLFDCRSLCHPESPEARDQTSNLRS